MEGCPSKELNGELFTVSLEASPALWVKIKVQPRVTTDFQTVFFVLFFYYERQHLNV